MEILIRRHYCQLSCHKNIVSVVAKYRLSLSGASNLSSLCILIANWLQIAFEVVIGTAYIYK